MAAPRATKLNKCVTGEIWIPISLLFGRLNFYIYVYWFHWMGMYWQALYHVQSSNGHTHTHSTLKVHLILIHISAGWRVHFESKCTTAKSKQKSQKNSFSLAFIPFGFFLLSCHLLLCSCSSFGLSSTTWNVDRSHVSVYFFFIHFFLLTGFGFIFWPMPFNTYTHAHLPIFISIRFHLFLVLFFLCLVDLLHFFVIHFFVQSHTWTQLSRNIFVLCVCLHNAGCLLAEHSTT